MTELFHFIGLCGDHHPSALTFMFGHLEVIEYLKSKIFNHLNKN